MLRNAKGQIAIFVVLVFQVVFILFAMTINIALVVHDKINFQNSLDMAVYYGAKQQTEVLNAMAHINYQMRQNWKLLAWRYRILGTLLQNEGHGSFTKYWCPQAKDDSSTNQETCRRSGANASYCSNSPLPYEEDYCDTGYFVCISNDLWKRGIATNDENICETYGLHIQPITGILQPPLPYQIESQMAYRLSRGLERDVGASCPKEGALNWLMTQFFLTHFRLDQRDRKVMMEEIFNRSLKLGRDLDGNSIFEGAKKVFFNNLSQANKKNVQNLQNYGLKDFNSFNGKGFDDAFKALDVSPVLQFIEIEGNNPGDCNTQKALHFKETAGEMERRLQDGGHALKDELKDYQKYLFNLNSRGHIFRRSGTGVEPIASLALGFIKDKRQVLYYALRGEFNYLPKNQIFSLILSQNIKFKASAFAKAFGGRFGPQANQTDPLIPVHHPSAVTKVPSDLRYSATTLQPNYSRWPGDKWGLIAKSLHDNSRHSNNFLNKHNTYDKQKVYTMEAFFHLIFIDGLADDPLSRLPYSNQSNFMRMMELMGVYPDVYDLSYYSIAGNYMQTYFPRICKLLKGGECQSDSRNKISGSRSAYIRGDFGWPETNYYIGKNLAKEGTEISIAPYFLKRNGRNVDSSEIKLPPEGDDSISVNGNRISRPLPDMIGDYILNSGVENPNKPLTKGRLFYPWLADSLPDRLLSSWGPSTEGVMDYDQYILSQGDFLNCPSKALENMPVPSACTAGGRNSYSVKLFSCEIVQELLDKPSNMNEYCP